MSQSDNFLDMNQWDNLILGTAALEVVDAETLRINTPANYDVGGLVSVSPIDVNGLDISLICTRNACKRVGIVISAEKRFDLNPDKHTTMIEFVRTERSSPDYLYAEFYVIERNGMTSGKATNYGDDLLPPEQPEVLRITCDGVDFKFYLGEQLLPGTVSASLYGPQLYVYIFAEGHTEPSSAEMLYYYGESPVPSPWEPPWGEGPTLAQSNFGVGLDPFSHIGKGTYEILQDPLGEFFVRLTSSSDPGSVRSSLSFQTEEIYGRIHLAGDILTPDETAWTGLVNITNKILYGTGLATMELDITQSQWRANYLENGQMVMRQYFGSVQSGKKYRVDIWVKVGRGDGEVYVLIDGELLFSRTGLTNDLPALGIDAFEVGQYWGYPDNIVDVYQVKINGVVNPVYTVTGRVIDPNTGESISEVAIGNAFAQYFTSVDGIFSLLMTSGTLDIKFIKVGRELLRLSVDVYDNIDLGDVSLQQVQERSPQAIQELLDWSIRAFTVFPYWGEYDTVYFDDLLDEMKLKFEDGINYVDVRAYFRNNPDTGIPEFWDDPHGDNTVLMRSSFAKLQSAAQKAHSRGIGMLMPITPCWGGHGTPDLSTESGIAAWFAAYKEICVSVCSFAEDNSIEAVELGFELSGGDSRYEDGTWNAYWQDILDAVRQVYSGMLSYHFNSWWQLSRYESLKNNDWWLGLDFLVCSIFIGLTYPGELDPTLAQLIDGWLRSEYCGGGYDYVLALGNLANYYSKDIVLNLGYSAGDGTNITPWGSTTNLYDEREQADCWDAFFYVFKDKGFVQGCMMEHFCRSYQPGVITGSFRGTFAEQYIKPCLLSHIVSPEPSAPMGALFTGAGLVTGAGIGYLLGGETGALTGTILGSVTGYLTSRLLPPFTGMCSGCGGSFTFTSYEALVWCPYCGEEQVMKKEGVKR